MSYSTNSSGKVLKNAEWLSSKSPNGLCLHEKKRTESAKSKAIKVCYFTFVLSARNI